MLTLLAVIGVLVVLFVAAVVATHNDEVLIDVLPDAADLDLPRTAIQAEDLTALRFSQAVRGYRMDEVDGVLERVSAELTARDRRLGVLQAELVTARRGTGSAPAAPRSAAAKAVPAPEAPPVTLVKPAPAEPAVDKPEGSVTLVQPQDSPTAPGTAPGPVAPPTRSDSPLSGFSLPDISPSGWTSSAPGDAPETARNSAATPESGEWFFDPAGSVEAPDDAAPVTPPTAPAPTAPDQTAPDQTSPRQPGPDQSDPPATSR